MKRIASLCLMAFLTALGGISLSAVTFEPGLPRLPIGDIHAIQSEATNRLTGVRVSLSIELSRTNEYGLRSYSKFIEGRLRYFYDMEIPVASYWYDPASDGNLGAFAQLKIRQYFYQHGNTFWGGLAQTAELFNNEPDFFSRTFAITILAGRHTSYTVNPLSSFFAGMNFFNLIQTNGIVLMEIPESAFQLPRLEFGYGEVPIFIPRAARVFGSYRLTNNPTLHLFECIVTRMQSPYENENYVWMPYDIAAGTLPAGAVGTITVQYDRDIACIRETFDIVTGEKICPTEFRIGLGRSGERTLLCVTGPCAPLVRLESSDDMKSWSTFSVIADFNGLSWTLPPGLNAPSDHPRKFFRAVAP